VNVLQTPVIAVVTVMAKETNSETVTKSDYPSGFSSSAEFAVVSYSVKAA